MLAFITYIVLVIYGTIIELSLIWGGTRTVIKAAKSLMMAGTVGLFKKKHIGVY